MYGLYRYLDSVTLTYILHSIDFFTFYVAFPYVLNYKAFNIQTLYSASSWCTDWPSTLTWWPWPIFCTPVTLTHFTLMFDISTNISPATTKPCIVLHLIILDWQVPWPGDLDVYLTHFTLMFDNSSTIRPYNHHILHSASPWCTDGRYLDPVTYISCSSDFYTFYVDIPLSLHCIIPIVSAEDISIRENGTGLE